MTYCRGEGGRGQGWPDVFLSPFLFFVCLFVFEILSFSDSESIHRLDWLAFELQSPYFSNLTSVRISSAWYCLTDFLWGFWGTEFGSIHAQQSLYRLSHPPNSHFYRNSFLRMMGLTWVCPNTDTIAKLSVFLGLDRFLVCIWFSSGVKEVGS